MCSISNRVALAKAVHIERLMKRNKVGLQSLVGLESFSCLRRLLQPIDDVSLTAPYVRVDVTTVLIGTL